MHTYIPCVCTYVYARFDDPRCELGFPEYDKNNRVDNRPTVCVDLNVYVIDDIGLRATGFSFSLIRKMIFIFRKNQLSIRLTDVLSI